ncbi:mCG1039111 [Mus musculus]|nr:mCG1039111 [Mus musculus]
MEHVLASHRIMHFMYVFCMTHLHLTVAHILLTDSLRLRQFIYPFKGTQNDIKQHSCPVTRNRVPTCKF